MMASMNISYEDLAAAAAQLRAGTEEIESLVSHVKALIESLVDNGYITAVTSPHFTEARAKVTSSSAGLVEGLEMVTRYLEATAQTYQETETQIAGQFNA